jgi:hypothetical protein
MIDFLAAFFMVSGIVFWIGFVVAFVLFRMLNVENAD